MFWNFWRWKILSFFEPKVDVNIIFIDYWKVLVLSFSEMGNTAFFWAKKLMEKWYLLITEKFLFWMFRWWEIRSFFIAKKLMERWYLLSLFELSMIFQDLGNVVFRAVDLAKSPILNMWLSSEYGYYIYSITVIKGMTLHVFLKFRKFCWFFFHFFVKIFLYFSSLWFWHHFPFSSLYYKLLYFHDRFQEGFKRKNFWSSWNINIIFQK